ncbi:MAG: diguanylate cyclase (GGDEF)-like protein/PAS domain S-box-containing protein [Lentisphaeria bacterium]|jgi:diguanylate cyclase (GGDEF)-like protein/PAS domain S-box-containing protein
MAYHILIVSSDAEDVTTLKNVFANVHSGSFTLSVVKKLSAAIGQLKKANIDAVIVDLMLPDSQGIVTYDQLLAAAPHTPIMTLIANHDDMLISKALAHGAQGYLTKNCFDSNLLPQAVQNLIRQKEIDLEYFSEKSRAEIALNSIGDAVLCTNLHGGVEYLNIAAETITGWPRDEAHGKPIAEIFNLINGVTRQAAPNQVEKVIEKCEPMKLNADTVLIRRDKSEVPIEDSVSPIFDWDGKFTGVVIVFSDVTVKKLMAKKMEHSAQHDFLTNLPNRLLLRDRIKKEISVAKRHGAQLAVLFLDIDKFKYINDSLGHETGDKLLQSVALRLLSSVRNSDTVSRQGGDEFVIVLAGKHGEDAALSARKINTFLAVPHDIGSLELHVTCSIGISVYPDDGKDAGTLLKHADTAMYCAKDRGRNTYQFFNNSMNVRAIERQFVDAGLRKALGNNEFVMHYQPIINLDTDAIIGAEALLRWAHPNGEVIFPDRFIPTAEENGLIVPIGRWVLHEACSQAKRWVDEGFPLRSIAVNISALEFTRQGFFEGVHNILKETCLPPSCLELEITETVLMRDVKTSAEILKKLKNSGVKIAVDDFGTGYSSLSYLRQFPIDVLKIDQSFLSDISTEKDNGAIVAAVIGMGNSLNLRVIAEGIENQKQLNFLKDRKCEEGQGFYLSKPLAVQDFTSLLNLAS